MILRHSWTFLCKIFASGGFYVGRMHSNNNVQKSILSHSWTFNFYCESDTLYFQQKCSELHSKTFLNLSFLKFSPPAVFILSQIFQQQCPEIDSKTFPNNSFPKIFASGRFNVGQMHSKNNVQESSLSHSWTFHFYCECESDIPKTMFRNRVWVIHEPFISKIYASGGFILSQVFQQQKSILRHSQTILFQNSDINRFFGKLYSYTFWN